MPDCDWHAHSYEAAVVWVSHDRNEATPRSLLGEGQRHRGLSKPSQSDNAEKLNRLTDISFEDNGSLEIN